jgi:signal transduction histidine kinase
MIIEDDVTPITLTGDADALKHALAELLLNSFQANPANAQTRLRCRVLSNGNGNPSVHLAIQDGGTGFTPEVARRAKDPFFSTRNVGLGLGLTVARKIIEGHQGRLEIVETCEGTSAEACATCLNEKGVVCVFLPLHSVLHPEPELTAKPPVSAVQPVLTKTAQAAAWSNR